MEFYLDFHPILLQHTREEDVNCVMYDTEALRLCVSMVVALHDIPGL